MAGLNCGPCIIRRQVIKIFHLVIRQAHCGTDTQNTGLVLGLFNDMKDPGNKTITLTKAAHNFNLKTNGKLLDYIRLSGPVPMKGETRIFYGLAREYSAVVVVGMGDDCVSYSEPEQMDELKEVIRCSAASGCRALQRIHVTRIFVESFGHAESSAEGAALGVWMFQELKSKDQQRLIPKLELHEDCNYTGWQIGLQKAAAQNLARQLCETPANLLTPIAFAQNSVEILCKAGVNVEVKVRNWAKIMEMEAFLAAARGSCEPPIFMEISYYGCEPEVSPIVLIGKGVTFDSGGLCLKDSTALKHMRGDMAGAACIVAACRAVSALQLPVNIRGLIPLCENLPGTCAMKPGDILKAKNGKTIVVEDTDYDGRLCLADALSYSSTFNPKFILDIGTLSKDLEECLGSAACGVFCNNDALYEQLRVASVHTGDRVWRLPLWEYFTEQVTVEPRADINEDYKPLASPCSAAAFLKEFVPRTDWVHMDTYGVNRTEGSTYSYLRKGMTGRPTRTVIEFLAQLACRPAIEAKDPTLNAQC